MEKKIEATIYRLWFRVSQNFGYHLILGVPKTRVPFWGLIGVRFWETTIWKVSQNYRVPLKGFGVIQEHLGFGVSQNSGYPFLGVPIIRNIVFG